VQGVIKSYDPATGDGVVLGDADLTEFDLAAGALEGSVFRMLRQGQRVVFELDDDGFATTLRLGSEVDMGTPVLSASDAITQPVAEQRELP
jgi:CspA family cold shock protein